MHQHRFDNGLVLLAEPMPWTESVSVSLLIPYGPVLDPPELEGLAGMVCEMTLRGAGSRDSRTFLQSLENLGCETSEAVSHLHTGYGASLLSANLTPALELLADQVRRPHLPKDQLDAVKQIARQNIAAMDDDPSRRLMLELYRNFLPDPWGRSSLGREETIRRIGIDDIRNRFERFFQPDGAILSLAGKFEWGAVLDNIGALFGDWKAQTFSLPPETIVGSSLVHLPQDSVQTHIGLAYPCEPLRSPDYMLAWSSVGILSGGMSCRLFDELREKRGLCYSVYASYMTLRDRAGVFCYCGTGADRARESLDTLVAELRRLRNGIEEDELERLKIRAKSALVLQQESTASRSSSMTRDWYHLGRIRTLNEIETNIDALTRGRINDYLQAHPVDALHQVTLGPEALGRSSIDR